MTQCIATGPHALSFLLRRQLLRLAEQAARPALLGAPSPVVGLDPKLSATPRADLGASSDPHERSPGRQRAAEMVLFRTDDGARGKLAVRGSISDVRPSSDAEPGTTTEPG